jgi:hypothetical protein
MLMVELISSIVGRLAMKTTGLLGGILVLFSAGLAAALAGGANFDHLNDADRKVFQERFTKEVWPLLERGGPKGCVGCHNGKIVSALKMTGNAEKDFRMLLKQGFFIPDDSGSLHTRIVAKNKKQMMPPPDKGDPWTKREAEVLRQFVDDLDKKQQPKKK